MVQKQESRLNGDPDLSNDFFKLEKHTEETLYNFFIFIVDQATLSFFSFASSLVIDSLPKMCQKINC